MPEGFKCLAFTKDNTHNHATVSDNRQCITIQGHPEFNRDTMKIVITKRTESVVLPEELSSKCLSTLAKIGPEMEDVWLVEKFLDFILNKL